jgi:hypothetical protein
MNADRLRAKSPRSTVEAAMGSVALSVSTKTATVFNRDELFSTSVPHRIATGVPPFHPSFTGAAAPA